MPRTTTNGSVVTGGVAVVQARRSRIGSFVFICVSVPLWLPLPVELLPTRAVRGSLGGRMNHRGTEDTEVTRQVIGAAIEVHRALGPGLLESLNDSVDHTAPCMTQHASSLPPSTAPEPTYAERARTLLARESIGTLSTQSVKHPGWPFGSVMPYVLTADGAPVFLISGMAIHTQN